MKPKRTLNLGIILTLLTLIGACNQSPGMEQKSNNPNLQTATFAGGCFWCMVGPFRVQDGVEQILSGYTGGQNANPTYEEVSSGSTGHIEAIEIRFDPAKVSYQTLLDIFWRQIDPTDAGGQFYDRGSQYETAIFYHSDEQKRLAEASKEALAKSGRFNKPIITRILPASTFYKAEDYHQDYDQKNSLRYKMYRSGSGRDRFLDQTWKKKE
jgi:peptide methionine sulfoxide reductase msrA/msrB